MLIWFLMTWFVTVFLTVAAASLYWKIDKTPWRGLFTALSMALVGIAMLIIHQAFASQFDAGSLAKILYVLCVAQALTQLMWAVRVHKRKRSAMNYA